MAETIPGAGVGARSTAAKGSCSGAARRRNADGAGGQSARRSQPAEADSREGPRRTAQVLAAGARQGSAAGARSRVRKKKGCCPHRVRRDLARAWPSTHACAAGKRADPGTLVVARLDRLQFRIETRRVKLVDP